MWTLERKYDEDELSKALIYPEEYETEEEQELEAQQGLEALKAAVRFLEQK